MRHFLFFFSSSLVSHVHSVNSHVEIQFPMQKLAIYSPCLVYDQRKLINNVFGVL